MTFEDAPVEDFIPTHGLKTVLLENVRNPKTYPINGEYDNSLADINFELLSSDRRTTLTTAVLAWVSGSSGVYAADLAATLVLTPYKAYWMHFWHSTFEFFKKVEAR